MQACSFLKYKVYADAIHVTVYLCPNSMWNNSRDVPDIRFRFRSAGYPAIFSNPVPVPAKMVPGTGYLSRTVLSLFVPSERLFSTAGGVITERRARLLPDNAEKLIFLKYNASLIKLE